MSLSESKTMENLKAAFAGESKLTEDIYILHQKQM